MITHSRILAVFAIVFLARGLTLAGDGTAVQGKLLGDDGKPFGGAQIYAQRTDAKAKPVIALTKHDGRYYFVGLPAGAYAITAYVDGVAMSRANIQTRSDGWVKVDFDLRLNTSETNRMQQDMRFGDGSIHPRDSGQRGGL